MWLAREVPRDRAAEAIRVANGHRIGQPGAQCPRHPRVAVDEAGRLDPTRLHQDRERADRSGDAIDEQRHEATLDS